MRMIVPGLLVTTALAASLGAAASPAPESAPGRDRRQDGPGGPRPGRTGPVAAAALMRVRLVMPPACAIAVRADAAAQVRCTSDIPFRLTVGAERKAAEGDRPPPGTRRVTVEY